MKISKIILHNYLHFKKDLEINLTYPEGHKQHGEPLDKVCIIGQSGTGKTALLNLIKCFTSEDYTYDDSCIQNEKLKNKAVEIHYTVKGENFYKVRSENDGFEYYKENILQKEEYQKHIKTLLVDSLPWLISFPFNVIPADTTDGVKSFDPEKLEFNLKRGTLESLSTSERRVWDLSVPDIDTISSLVFIQIDNYIKKYNNVSVDILNEIVANEDRVKELIEKRKSWEFENPSPIKKIADDFLNELLSNLGLEIETNPKYYNNNGDTPRDKYNFLILKQKGQQVKYKFLSTGTKQLILTALPLFSLAPKNSIILFDQPEASLFPDIQQMVPTTYSKIASQNQFFYATHSPIVASAFDPWEVVDLKFDTTSGDIYRKEYFDTKDIRNVANYNIFPKYLRWDSIFKIMFGLSTEGNEERNKQLMNLASMESELIKIKDIDEKKKKFSEYVKLAACIDFTPLSLNEKTE
jgi:ABC-type lipoprotein export system ATPase subunit